MRDGREIDGGIGFSCYIIFVHGHAVGRAATNDESPLTLADAGDIIYIAGLILL